MTISRSKIPSIVPATPKKRGRPRKAHPKPEVLVIPNSDESFKHSQEFTIANLKNKIEQYKIVVDYLETKLGLPK